MFFSHWSFLLYVLQLYRISACHVNNTDVKLSSRKLICKSNFYSPPPLSQTAGFQIVSCSRSKPDHLDRHSGDSQVCAGRFTLSLVLSLSAVNPETKMIPCWYILNFDSFMFIVKRKCDLKCLCKAFFFYLFFIRFSLLSCSGFKNNIFAWNFNCSLFLLMLQEIQLSCVVLRQCLFTHLEGLTCRFFFSLLIYSTSWFPWCVVCVLTGN